MPDAKEINVLLVPPHGGHARLVTIPAQLENFQRLVGGLIQVLPLGGAGSAYVNEEGKYKFDHELHRNRDAEKLLAAAGTELLPGDFIVGPMVVFGGYDADGYDVSVTANTFELVRSVGLELL